MMPGLPPIGPCLCSLHALELAEHIRFALLELHSFSRACKQERLDCLCKVHMASIGAPIVGDLTYGMKSFAGM